MKKDKAERKLTFWKEDLEYWRQAYVEACRDKHPTMDLYMSSLEYGTIREGRKHEAIEQINAAKQVIAKYERICR